MNDQKNIVPIEPIMEQIREQIKKESKKQESSDFAQDKGVQNMNLPEIRDQLHRTWNIGQRPFTSHRPFFGIFVVLYKKMFLPLMKLPLCNYLEDQTMFNAAVVQNLDSLVAQQEQFNRFLMERTDFLFQQLDKKVETIDAHLQAVKQKQLPLMETVATMLKSFDEEREKVAQIEKTVDMLRSALQDNREKTEVYLQKQLQLNEMITSQHNRLQVEQEKVAHLEKSLIQSEQTFGQFKKTLDAIQVTLHENQETLVNHDYYVFNDKYRDSIEVIKQRQAIYLPYFENCKNLVDLGCGRGEFLELLRNHNIPAIGVDINQEMVAVCKTRGLNVQDSNLLDFLANSPDASFDGIFSAQVVEHLTLAEIKKMFALIAKKLQPNGCVIIETVNPLSLFSYARNFLLDISHRTPLHPNALRFLMECAELHHIETRFTSPVPAEEMLPNIKIPQKSSAFNEVSEAWQNINQMAHRLNEVVFGWQEYAIIARR